MANYSTIKTPGAFVPQNSDYPTHEDIYGKGGYMVVASRTGISTERVKKGMLVYDNTEGKIYKCVDATKSNQTAGWEELKLGSNLDDLEIGGRNLLRDSNFTNKTTYNTNTYWLYFPDNTYRGQYELSVDNGWLKLHSTCTSYDDTTPRLGFRQIGQNGNNEFDYVLSFDAYASTPVKFNASSGYGSRLPATEVTIGTSQSRYSFVVRGYNSNSADYNVFFACITEGTPADIWFNNFKLEKGNKPTDWTPAFEDYLPLSGGTMKGDLKLIDSSITVTDQLDDHVVNVTNTSIELTNNDNDKFSICIDASKGEINAPAFIKRGGTNSEFLMADGSVNDASYATVASVNTLDSKAIKQIQFNGVTCSMLSNGLVLITQAKANWDTPASSTSYSIIANKPPFIYTELKTNLLVVLDDALNSRKCATEATFLYKNISSGSITITFPSDWINMSSSTIIYTVPAGKYAEFVLTYWPKSVTGRDGYLVTYNGAVQP